MVRFFWGKLFTSFAEWNFGSEFFFTVFYCLVYIVPDQIGSVGYGRHLVAFVLSKHQTSRTD
jgi:hypothetical protein